MGHELRRQQRPEDVLRVQGGQRRPAAGTCRGGPGRSSRAARQSQHEGLAARAHLRCRQSIFAVQRLFGVSLLSACQAPWIHR